MRLTTTRSRLQRFVTFVHLPFSVRSPDLFVASLVFMKGTLFAFEGQNMKFTVNMLLTCIIYCDARPGRLIKTACKYSM